jgi:hypothetical protein
MGRGVIYRADFALDRTGQGTSGRPDETLLQVFPLSKLGYTINGEYKKPEIIEPEPKPAPVQKHPWRERTKEHSVEISMAENQEPDEEEPVEKPHRRNRRFCKKRRKPNNDKKS